MATAAQAPRFLYRAKAKPRPRPCFRGKRDQPEAFGCRGDGVASPRVVEVTQPKIDRVGLARLSQLVHEALDREDVHIRADFSGLHVRIPETPGDAAFVPTPYGAVDLIRALPPQPLPSLEILISDKLASDPPMKDHNDIGCPEDLDTSSHP